MSLDFDDRVKTGNVVSIWYIILKNDNPDYHNDCFEIATSEFIDSGGDYYYPIIKNKPSIRTSINLAKSTAKTSDVTLTCINEYLPSKLLSEELLYGDWNYINQPVYIYQAFDKDTTPNGVQIYTGRLIDVSHDHETCTLKIQSARPWDFISMPNVLTTNAKVPIPCAYGDFTPNVNSYWDGSSFGTSSDTGFHTDLTSNTLRPVMWNNATDRHAFFIADESAKSDSRAEYWDKGLQIFLPINDSSNSAPTTSVLNDGGYCSKANLELKRAVGIRPTSHTLLDSNWQTYMTGDGVAEEMYDFTGAWYNTYGNFNDYLPDSAVNSTTIKFEQLPSPEGEFSQGKLVVGFSAISNSHTSGDKFAIYGAINGGSFTLIEDTSAGGVVHIYAGYNSMDITEIPESLEIKLEHTNGGGDGGASIVVNIYNIYWLVEMKARDDRTETVYIGADGYDADYTGGSGVVANIPEAHRDILDRFGNLDETTPDGFSTLTNGSTGVRENWKIRYWLTESTDMGKVLEKLQFEGCFIFTFSASGGMRYISIPTSFSADETFGDDDLSRVNISHTPFSELQTQYDIRYKRHPAENRYLSSETYQSGGGVAIRNQYNILTKENIREIKLDALVDDDGGDMVNFADYYFKIFGDIKIIVSGEIINPAKWGVEVGDIVDFSTSLEPYGGTWSGKYFMITDVTRKIDSVSIKCREVS